MWAPLIEKINESTIHYKISDSNSEITYRNWIDLIQNSIPFIDFYTDLLKENPFEGFFWEVKAIVENALDDPFEFVLVNGPQFSRIEPNSKAFSSHFESSKEAVTFSNLGGDAQLVVPVKNSEETNYTHLASFLRTASEKQIRSFWSLVGLVYQKEINENNLWMSTAGMGVYWLHVRLDQRPKYYRYSPFT